MNAVRSLSPAHTRSPMWIICSKTNKGEQGESGGRGHKTSGRYIFKKIVFQDISKQ